MRIRIAFDDIGDYTDVTLPDDHEFVTYANDQVKLSDAKGHDAVAVYENALTACVAGSITVTVIPDAGVAHA